jgi:hypothetical protein
MFTAQSFVGQHPDGGTIHSLYPGLWEVTYRARIGGRMFNVCKVITANSESHARERVSNSAGASIYGGIVARHVGDLEPERVAA